MYIYIYIHLYILSSRCLIHGVHGCIFQLHVIDSDQARLELLELPHYDSIISRANVFILVAVINWHQEWIPHYYRSIDRAKVFAPADISNLETTWFFASNSAAKQPRGRHGLPYSDVSLSLSLSLCLSLCLSFLCRSFCVNTPFSFAPQSSIWFY